MDREVLDANAGAEQAAQQLRVAAQGGQLEAVRQLLQEDAFCASSADGTDTEGRTALHLAALNRHLEIVQALLAHRAAVTADAEGETPLHHAAFSGRAAIVAELLAARASRTAENANGRTPLDYAQLKGSKEVLALLTAEPLVDEETASQEHPPPLLNILHFAIRQRPAVVEGADEISYHGHIKLGAAICYISFPGKYKAGWDALIAGLHGSSVACVFLCAAQDGLGQHAVDPDDPRGRCYCHRIYGERTYKEFGYLHFVKKKRTDCTDEEIRKIEEKAKAMNGVVVFADATPEERMEKEMEAQELWERHQRTASWGCAWYHVWLARVKQAVADGQRLKVVFFPGEVGLGKVTMRELASANLWDGIGCGGSQKCEIATIEAMRQLTGDPRWDYEGVDVGDFLLEQFRVGDHVEALDGQRWCQGRILEAPKEDLQKDQKPTWKIQCNWSSKEFLSEHIRPVTAETDGLQRLLEAFVDPSLQRVLERLSGLKLQAVQASDGRRSMAVQVKIENVREAQLLRDQVLSGELESVVNEVLSRHSTLKCFPWEIGLDKTAFFELYERTLMSLSDLTAHQQEKLEELESVENPVIHLSAPAGAGKTFVAVMHVLKRLEATGDGERRHLVLYVAPNKALLFHFLRWFMVFASTKTVRWRQHLARIVVMCQPYQKCMKPTITETRIQLDPVEASSEEFLLVVMDEAHHMFCSQTDLAQQEMLQKIPAQQKLLLSDVSQSDGSQKDLTFDRFFPDRYQVALSQVVRSTQRIVAGARAFQLSAADAVKSSSLGTDGPPVKSFIFEVEGKEGNASREEIMMHYVKYTMDAFWHLMQTFSTLSFDRRLSLLVPDERFREDFQRLLDLELQKEFPHRRFQLVTCEESLSYLPSHMMAVNAEVYAGESIVLDTIENAKGLEQLIVISIGLDGGQDGDRLTRARLYQGITRAQLVALVVNEFVEDGLLAFLSKVKLKGAQRFQPKAAFAEIRTDAAAALVASPPKKVSAEAPPLAVSAARPVPEEVLPIPATARTTGGSAAETSKELPPRRSSVWDTESNALGAGARAVAGRGLRFDPMESMLEAYQRAVTLMELELIRDAARSLKEAEDVNFYQFNQEHVLSKTAPPDGIVLRGVRAPPQVAQSLLRDRRGRRFRSSVHVTREIVQMDAQRLRSGAVGTTQGAEVMADGRLAVSVDVTHGSFVAGDGLFIDSIAVGGPEEIDLTGSISYKEFLSPKPCIAQWYCCHWWGESLDSFVSSCQTHAQLRRRGSPGSAGGYWVAAFAMRQHELREELGPDLKESPFYDALRLADGILLTVDSEEVFRRTWCHYELYAGSDLKHLDVVCNGAMLSRTGLPGESMVAKQLREKGFDWELLLKGLTMNCEASRATVLADRRMFAAIFDQEGTLKVDETVCSTFALLAWPQAVKRGLVSTQLIETVASDVNREALELSLAHLQEFQDPGMLQLAQSLPPNLTKLKLGLEGCHELTDQGVKALANRWGTKLKHLYLDFVGCGKLTDASLSVLAQNLPPTLTDLELHMAGCVLVGPPGMEHLKKHWPKSVKVFRASFKATKLNRNFMTLQDLEDYWRES